MSNFTPKQIVDHLVETTGDPKWFVNTKSIGFQVGHKWKQPQYVQRYVTEAVKQLTAKQKKIANVAGDPNQIDSQDLATLRSGNNLPPEAQEAMKSIASSDAAPEHKQAAIDALLKKHGVKANTAAELEEATSNEEIEQIDEETPHSKVNNLKANGKHKKAGQLAYKHGLPRKYGQHFGLRSTRAQDEQAFLAGYDAAEESDKPMSHSEWVNAAKPQGKPKWGRADLKNVNKANEEVELDEGLEKISRDEFDRRHAAMKAALGDTGVHSVKRKFHMAVNKLLGHQKNTNKANRNVYDGTYIMPKGGPKGEHRPLVHFKRSLAQKIGDAVFRRTGRADEYYAVTEQTTEELSGMKTYKQFVNQIDEGKGAGERYKELVDAVGKPMRSAMRPKNTPKPVKEDIVNENEYERVSDFSHKIVADKNPTHKVTVVNSPQGGAGWRGRYHTYEVHVNAQNDEHAKKLAVQAVRDHNKKGGWEPPFVPTPTNPDYPSVQKINEQKDLHPSTVAILTGAKKSSASMRNKLLAMHGNHPQVKALIAKGDIDTGKGLSAKQASKSVDDDEGDDGLEGPDQPLKAAAHPHGYVRTTATGGSVRQKNMERMKAAMAKGTAHGSSVGGGMSKASPVDAAFAPRAKSVGATGESPAEKQDAENAKKEAPKGQKRAPGRLTGKKLSMSGKED